MANTIVSIQDVYFIVNILENGFPSCGGSILLPHVIVTAAHCVYDPVMYSVLSGSSCIDHGISHNLLRKIIYLEFHPAVLPDDLAVLLIAPPVDLYPNSINQSIPLHNGHVNPHEFTTVSGWGCTNEIGSGIINIYMYIK